jgi:hypothetical protein
MKRRGFLVGLAALAVTPWVRAGVLDSITGPEAAQALRDSLTQGAKAALSKLGKVNGYYANPQVKIGLPKNFARAERILRALGHGKQVDALVLSMNRAAEMAVPKAEVLVVEAAQKMSVQDAKTILAGGDQAVTECFHKTTESQLSAELMPIIKNVAEPSGLTRAYKAMASTLVQLAGLKSEQATVEDYVNKKALDGIYAMIGMEERALRANPTQYAGGLTGKVFSLIKQPRS